MPVPPFRSPSAPIGILRKLDRPYAFETFFDSLKMRVVDCHLFGGRMGYSPEHTPPDDLWGRKGFSRQIGERPFANANRTGRKAPCLGGASPICASGAVSSCSKLHSAAPAPLTAAPQPFGDPNCSPHHQDRAVRMIRTIHCAGPASCIGAAAGRFHGRRAGTRAASGVPVGDPQESTRAAFGSGPCMFLRFMLRDFDVTVRTTPDSETARPRRLPGPPAGGIAETDGLGRGQYRGGLRISQPARKASQTPQTG